MRYIAALLSAAATARASVLTNGEADVAKLGAIAYDPYTNGYYTIGERVGNAFADGMKLK